MTILKFNDTESLHFITNFTNILYYTIISLVNSDDLFDWLSVQGTHTDMRHTTSAECLVTE